MKDSYDNMMLHVSLQKIKPLVDTQLYQTLCYQIEESQRGAMVTSNIDGDPANVSIDQVIEERSTYNEAFVNKLMAQTTQMIPALSKSYTGHLSYMERMIQNHKKNEGLDQVHKHKTIYGHAIMNDAGSEPTLIGCMCLDKTGVILLTGADDGLVKVWSTYNGRLITTLNHHANFITDIIVSPDNAYFAISSKDHCISLWNVKSLKLYATLIGNDEDITKLDFVTYGINNKSKLLLLSSGNDGYINIYSLDLIKQNVDHGETSLIPPSSKIGDMKRKGISKQIIIINARPSDGIVAAGCDSGEIFLWKIIGKRSRKMTKSECSAIEPVLVSTVLAHKKECLLLEWSLTDLLLSGSPDGRAKIWFLNKDENIELKCELDMKKTLVSNSARCCSIAWSSNSKYALACICGKTKTSEISRAQSYLIAWNSFTEEAVVFGENKPLIGYSFTLCPHPTNEEIVLMGAGYGQLILWNIQEKYVIQEFWETGAYVFDPFKEVDVFDGCFVPGTRDFIVVTSCGTISFYGIRSSEPFSVIPVEQFRKCDYPQIIGISNEDLCTVNMIKYEFPPSSSDYTKSQPLGEELYEMCYRIRKQKCAIEQQIYDYLEQDAQSYLNIQLANPSDENVDTELQAMEERKQEQDQTHNANLQEYHRNRQNLMNELRRQRIQDDQQSNENSIIEKDEPEEDSGSDYAEEMSIGSDKISKESASIDGEEEEKKVKLKQKKATKEKEESDLYYIEESEDHKKCFCKICRVESFSNIVSLKKSSDQTIHVNTHYDCLEKNDIIVLNKKRVEHLEKCIDSLLQIEDMCQFCNQLYPTVSCIICKTKFHGYSCAEYCGGFYEQKYQCIECTNKKNAEIVAHIIETKPDLNLQKLRLAANQNWVNDNKGFPQVGEKVYYLYEGHMKYISAYSIISAYGQPIIKPWKDITELMSPCICKVDSISYIYPSDSSLILYDHYQIASYIIMELKLVIESNGNSFMVNLIPNMCPDFLIEKNMFEKYMRLLKNKEIKVNSDYIFKSELNDLVKVLSIKKYDYCWEAIEVYYLESSKDAPIRLNAWELEIDKEHEILPIFGKSVVSSLEIYKAEIASLDLSITKDIEIPYIPQFSVIIDRVISGHYKTEAQFKNDYDLLFNACTDGRDKRSKAVKKYLINLEKMMNDEQPKRTLRNSAINNEGLISIENGVITIDKTRLPKRYAH